MVRNRLQAKGMDLPEKLDKLFKANRWSYRDVESLLKPLGVDVSYQTVRRWTLPGADPTVSQVVALSRLLGVPILELVDPSVDEARPPSWARITIEKWIARNGEDWALDRLARIPEDAPADPPESRPVVSPPRFGTEAPGGVIEDSPPATPRPAPGSSTRRGAR